VCLAEEARDDGDQDVAFNMSHKAIADQSRNGRHLIAEKSGHHVQIDQPDLVASVIQDVVSAVRK
jgi:pimeloyl-ACP methyl ester carboxylesterase